MFYRKLLIESNKTKEIRKESKQALIIRGPRQVGKTTLALMYAKENYKNICYINFLENNRIKEVFQTDLNVDRLIRDLSAFFPNVKFEAYNTVIIFDEIQECARARMSLKQFMLDGRFDCIGIGSLLGIRGYNRKYDLSVPTGFESFYNLSSLDFEEYLLAKGISNDVIDYLNKCVKNKESINDSIHNLMLEYFREYIVVGGMPQVITTFNKYHDLGEVRKNQRNIIEQYKDDFGKHIDDFDNAYTNNKELNRILLVFNSISSQLAKENKKFQYSKIKTGARSKEFYDAINFLVESGLVIKCHNLNALDLPLQAYSEEEAFKLYFFDTGLFISLLDDYTASDILLGNLGIYKGAIFENIVADSLKKQQNPLYYYNKNNSLKLDFIYRLKDKIIPLEIKASNGNSKSLRTVLNHYDEYKVKYGIKLTANNISFNNNILNLPYYLTFLLNSVTL